MLDDFISAQIRKPENRVGHPISGRLQSLQLIRFFASFVVLITHCGFYVHWRMDGAFDYWQRGAAGVTVFFVVSGFVIMLSVESVKGKANDWKIFTMKRLLRIVPIYWIATTAKVFALLFFQGSVLHARLEPAHIIQSYFFIPYYNEIDNKVMPFLGVGWTLVYEMLFYILVSLALLLKRPPIIFVGSLLLLISILSVFRDDILDIRRQPLLYFVFNSILIWFAAGMVLGVAYLRKLYLPTGFAMVAIGLSLFSILFDALSLIYPLSPFVSIGLASVFLIWGAISLERNVDLHVPRAFVFLGEASYSTYLFHPLVAPIVPTLMQKLGLIAPLVSTAATISVALVLASIVYVFLERPLTRFLAGRLPYAE